MKQILITGAAGFIGRHLVTSLQNQKNISLRVFDQNQDLVKIFPTTESIIGDVGDKKKLKEAFLGNPPEAVVHLAAVIKSSKKEDYIKVNIQGTENLLRLTEIFGVKKFIFISTDYVLYDLPDWYSQSKRYCEKILQSSKSNFTIFRPSPVFGLGDNKNFATLISIVKKYPILPTIKCQMEPVYVGDVVKMIIASLEDSCPPRQVYNLPGGSLYDFREILTIISRLLGLKRIIIPFPEKFFLLALKFYKHLIPNPLLESYQVRKWLRNYPLDASLVKKDLNYSPLSFEEGMRLVLKKS